MVIKRNEPQILQKDEYFRVIPEYLHYILTGVRMNEYTNAKTQDWDDELMNVLAYRRKSSAIYHLSSLERRKRGCHAKTEVFGDSPFFCSKFVSRFFGESTALFFIRSGI